MTQNNFNRLPNRIVVTKVRFFPDNVVKTMDHPSGGMLYFWV
jgi:hypothetical protein